MVRGDTPRSFPAEAEEMYGESEEASSMTRYDAPGRALVSTLALKHREARQSHLAGLEDGGWSRRYVKDYHRTIAEAMPQ
jgi:hypothetical protein